MSLHCLDRYRKTQRESFNIGLFLRRGRHGSRIEDEKSALYPHFEVLGEHGEPNNAGGTKVHKTKH